MAFLMVSGATECTHYGANTPVHSDANGESHRRGNFTLVYAL